MMSRKQRRQIREKCFNNIMNQMNLLRKERCLTDVTLKCGKKEFLVHKVIVCAGIPLFRKHLNNSEDSSLVINFMNSETLQTILEFIYTGQVVILEETTEFLKDLIEATTMLQIPLLCKCAMKLLLNRTSTEDILSQLHIIEQLKSETIKTLFLEHLVMNMRCLRQREDFLNLSFDQLNSILTCPRAASADQEQIVELIIAWVKQHQKFRKTMITSLLQKVNFEKLNGSYLLKLIDEPLIQENSYFNKSCVSVLRKQLIRKEKNSLKAKSKSSTENRVHGCSQSADTVARKLSRTDTQKALNSRKNSATKYRRSLSTEKLDQNNIEIKNQSSLIFCHGFTEDKRTIMNFNSETRKWDEMTDLEWMTPPSKFIYSEFCGVENYLCYFGEWHDCAMGYFFDSLQNHWLKFPGMKGKRIFASICKLDEFIYVIGGWTEDRSYVKTVERCNLSTSCWQCVADLPEKMDSYPAVAAVDGLLCLVGKSNLLWYHPITDEWTVGEPLPVQFNESGRRFISAGKGKILILEGKPNNIYIYDIQSKAWRIEAIPSDLSYCTDIANLQNPESLEFLVVGPNNCYIYKELSSWERFPPVEGIIFPQLIILRNQ